MTDRLKICLDKLKYDGLLSSNYEIKPTKLPRKKQAKKNKELHFDLILRVPVEKIVVTTEVSSGQ